MIIVIIDNYSGGGERNHSFRQQYSANVMNGEKINNEKTPKSFSMRCFWYSDACFL